ncbi:hypothetical protein N7465_003613 [Penicillium sp. CMV-2018d]|nr:hypothetical protein N7465_003613 [Penicillium sp. CMV-2018d]
MSKTTSEEDDCPTPDSLPTTASSISLNNHIEVSERITEYYRTKGRKENPRPSALLLAAQNERATVYAIFGGQGVSSPLHELQELYAKNAHLIGSLVQQASCHLQRLLVENPRFASYYPAGLDVTSWILHPEDQPPSHELSRAPISLLVIGLLQLANYQVLIHALGLNPGQMSTFFRGIGGHSQGIVPAVMVSSAQDWESLDRLSLDALTILFFIGCRAQSCFDVPPVSVEALTESESHGEGVPSCMLRVHGLSLDALHAVMYKINSQIPDSEKVELALINGPRNFVLGGPPAALYSVNRYLRRIKAAPGISQARVPFSQRKPDVATSYLPISVPFHTSHLATACMLTLHDLRNIYLARSNLHISVYDTGDGSDLSDGTGRDIIPDLVRMIMIRQLDWAKTAEFPKATHLVDLGPGTSQDGIGMLTDKLKLGSGVRTMVFSASKSSSPEFGDREELLDHACVTPGRDWVEQYGPKLVISNAPTIETKMTKLLGLPPLMVAGMTPTTSSWEFVAATMRAGYHIELATGGFHDAASLEAAIRSVINNTPLGRGVTCNVIYANPRALKWQLAVIKKMQAQHYPIEGLTIGAGIPSPDVASSYIQDLGLKHISFKPGSVQAVKEVINIAKLNPDFPIILQWTGGRAGGHHSFEDFHEPILQTYHRIRSCSNIILVAGSGFGDANESYPYLTGEWSTGFGFAPMPYDGILLGSRVMVAREARTSEDAKGLIVKASGVSNHEWEQSYDRPAGGIVTVISEMGEPIHKVATRAVQFWSELDKTVFCLDKAKQSKILAKNKMSIINRLNCDYSKVWFGQTTFDRIVDIEEMTYEQVVSRLIDLTYLKNQGRWIHPSYCDLLLEFVSHLESRWTASSSAKTRVFRTRSDAIHPAAVLQSLQDHYSQNLQQLISKQDEALFTAICRKSGRKPVPFITALDDKFEYYFKKDSLWQSEDIECVYDQDIQRTCILHGPVAAKFSQRSDQSIHEILGDIHQGYINSLERSGPVRLEPPDAHHRPSDGQLKIERFQIDEECLNDEELWYQRISQGRSTHCRVALAAQTMTRERQIFSNPIKSLFRPHKGIWIKVEETSPGTEVLSIYEDTETSEGRKVTELRVAPNGLIDLEIINYETANGQPASLKLEFGPGNTLYPLRDLTLNLNERVKELYQRIWFGDEPTISGSVDIASEFDGGEFKVSTGSLRLFAASIGNTSQNQRAKAPRIAPLDYAVVIAWKALIKPLFVLDANLLRLVHLQNSFQWVQEASCIRENDVVSTTSRVSSVVTQESGTLVEVKATINREGLPVVHITSQFLLRDAANLHPHITPFKNVEEQPSEVALDTANAVAILESKPWFKPHEAPVELLGKTIIFRPQSRYLYGPTGDVRRIEVSGTVHALSSRQETETEVGVICWQSTLSTNIVTRYLNRHGHPSTTRVLFDTPLNLHIDPDTFMSPADNTGYARASSDLNPIHISKSMAAYAELPGTIAHGMHTSARVRGVLSSHMCGSDESLFHSFNVAFTGMVLANEPLQLYVQHIGMVEGRRVVQFTARDKSGHTVVKGEAEMRNAPTAILFTGQGSQQKGMGMELYQSSAVSRKLWDRADTYFLNTYGFRISDIVIKNPKSLTVRFGGILGRKLRDNYRALRYLAPKSPGESKLKATQIFPEIDHTTTSYTFRSDAGLLSATQFTQPALTLMELAIYEDLKSRGVLSPTATFAGHSLGEYAAIAAVGKLVPLETLMAIAFYRGLSMQIAVQRDSAGRSAFAMCALNPSKLSPAIDGHQVETIVKTISEETGWLIEIVNYNIQGQQYVCAGDVRALLCLTKLLDSLFQQPPAFKIGDDKSSLIEGVQQAVARILPSIPKSPLSAEDLPRGKATTPLAGIDVPFHSSFMKDGIPAFRQFLYSHIACNYVDPQRLIRRYVPNLTARLFDIDKDYFEVTNSLTGSPVLTKVLNQWDEIHAETEDPARVVQLLRGLQEKVM